MRRAWNLALVLCLLFMAPVAAAEPPAAGIAAPPGVKDLMNRLRRAVKSGDLEEVARQFDVPSMAKELTRKGGMQAMWADLGLGDLSDALEGFYKSMNEDTVRTALVDQPMIEPFTQFRVGKFHPGKDGAPCVVHVRVREATGWGHRRVWMVKKHGSWRIADIEFSEIGLRLTGALDLTIRMAGSMFSGMNSKVFEAFLAMFEALPATAGGADDDLYEKLSEIPDRVLPAHFEATRLMVLAAGDVERGEGKRALERLDAVNKVLPEAPYTELLRGWACVSLGRSAEAVKHADTFLARMGPDVRAYTVLAEAKWRLGQTALARTAAQKAVADDPGSGLALAWLAVSSPLAAHPTLANRLRALEPRAAQFAVLAELLTAESAGPALAEFGSAYRKLEPDSPAGPFHAAQGRLLMKQTQAALPLFEAALSRVTDPARIPHYQRPLLEILADQHKPARAYALARDKEDALAFLGPKLVARGDAAALDMLVSHVKKDVKGVLAEQRELLVAQGDYLRQDYADVVARMTPWVKRVGALRDAAEEEDELLDPHLRLTDAETILVRALIRTDRLEEAEVLARPIHEDHEDPRHLALVLLAKGDYDEALGILAWVVGEEWWPASQMLQDPDIEKHLSHEKLAEFKQELEEAAKAEAEDG